MTRPTIALLCATQRGLTILRRVRALAPEAELKVFSFREEPWEPPFLDDIAAFCREHSLAFVETRNVASAAAAPAWEDGVDVALMVHWRYLVPAAVLAKVRRTCAVVHDSLLPEYRGFSPTVWAMINGEKQCGATLLHAADAVDAGHIIDQEAVPIGIDDTIATVTERVTGAYVAMIERTIAAMIRGDAPRIPQDHARATYTCKRTPEDARIDWRAGTDVIHNLIRASSRPYTGAYAYLGGRKLRIWSARPDEHATPFVGRIPGRVVQIVSGKGVGVLTGDGVIFLQSVQFDDDPEVCAAEVIRSISATLTSTV
ncbi:MAG TPA: formyltransferase family protein [Gemmatimonadaceae bacterium]|jgi:methionyl-tRNA formyltransferase